MSPSPRVKRRARKGVNGNESVANIHSMKGTRPSRGGLKNDLKFGDEAGLKWRGRGEKERNILMWQERTRCGLGKKKKNIQAWNSSRRCDASLRQRNPGVSQK